MAWESWNSASLKRKLLLVAASAVWCVLLILAARALDLNEPYLPFAIAGGLIFYFRNQTKVENLVACLILAVGFGLVVRLPQSHDWMVTGSGMVALAGLGAFLMFGLQWIWSEQPARRQTIAMLAPAGALVFFVFSAQRALSLANLFYPKTYDLYLYAADGAFGFQPSFLLGRALASSHALRAISLLAYLTLPLVMALVYALRLPKGAERPSWDIISLLMLAGMGGWALYNVVPGTGPIYVFGASFPWQALPYHSLPKLFLEKIPVSGSVPRNAIPSLHVAWVLLLYWNTRGLSRHLRVFMAAYLALTVAATLGTGEHYFVDLIAAVPFALMIQAVVSPERKRVFSQRVFAASCGLGLTFVWLFLVRYGAKVMLLSPVVPWGLSIATCAGVWMIHSWFSSLPVEPKPEATRTQAAAEKPLAFAAHN